MAGNINTTNTMPIEELASMDLDMDDFDILNIKDVNVNGNVTIAGNATINGTLFAVNSESLNVADNHIYLNSGYTVLEASLPNDGGLVVNRGTTGDQADVTSGAFTAGVDATSNPTVILDSATIVFALADIIQVSGSVSNDGIYEVFSQSGTTLTIRGVGTNLTVETWTQNQFIAETGTTVSIDKVLVTVMKSNVSTGAWEEGSASTTPVSFTPFTTNAAGADTQIQFNDGGAFGADAELTYNQSTNILSVTNLSVIEPILLPLRSFSATNNTATLGFASLYACTDTTAARTLTLSTVDIQRGTATKPWFFDVKDESGGAGTNNITIDTEGSETIDGVSSIDIQVDYGVLRLYSNGSNLFTR